VAAPGRAAPQPLPWRSGAGVALAVPSRAETSHSPRSWSGRRARRFGTEVPAPACGPSRPTAAASHTDIGYTEIQTEIEDKLGSINLLSAWRSPSARRTPRGARFVVERRGAWPRTSS
jgi:hypothetical protein